MSEFCAQSRLMKTCFMAGLAIDVEKHYSRLNIGYCLKNVYIMLQTMCYGL